MSEHSLANPLPLPVKLLEKQISIPFLVQLRKNTLQTALDTPPKREAISSLVVNGSHKCFHFFLGRELRLVPDVGTRKRPVWTEKLVDGSGTSEEAGKTVSWFQVPFAHCAVSALG